MVRYFLASFFIFILCAKAQNNFSSADSKFSRIRNVVIDTIPKALDTLSNGFDTDPSVIHTIPSVLDTIPSVLDTLPKIKDSIPNKKVDSLRLGPKKEYPSDKKKKQSKPLPYIKPMDSVTVADYRIMNMDDTETFIDTTLTIEKEYRFNFLKKDIFELMSFANMGENYNKLGYDFTEGLIPQLGARATHYGYFEKEDINYFEVPSPLSELYFKTAFEQGHHLESFVTLNTSPRFNMALAYRGFRSLGKYVSSKAAASQFRFSSQYQSYDKRYRLRFHFASQTLDRQVNGGLTNSSVYFFEEAPNYLQTDENGDAVLDQNGDEVYEFYDGFLDRSRLSTQIRGENQLNGKRYFLEQHYKIFPKVIDSTTTVYNLKLGHRFNYETKFYEFSQTSPDDYFLENYEVTAISDRSQIKTMENTLFLNYKTPLLGSLSFNLHSYFWNYFFKEKEYEPDPVLSDGIQTSQFAFSAGWTQKLLKFNLNASLYKSLKSDFSSDQLSLGISRQFFKKFDLSAEYQYKSQAPNFNFQLFKSDYTNYNWENQDFKNQQFSNLSVQLGHKKWGVISASWTTLNNYTYFRNYTQLESLNEELLTLPAQAQTQIDYFKLRLYQNLSFGKFSLVNTIQYQDTQQKAFEDSDATFEPHILNVPKFITRNTVMFSSQVFKKAMFLQTGITFNFFTDYYADLYNPLIGEFVTQNNTKIGEFPRIDLFINAKIQQTRVFFKYEHLNNSQSGYNYFSAPFTPYRDRIIRFGLVWNFFQ